LIKPNIAESIDTPSGTIHRPGRRATLVEYFASRTNLLVFSYHVPKYADRGFDRLSLFAANKVSGASRPQGLTGA